MSGFHYVRTLGEDGGVDAVDGQAEGMALEEILKDGLPPYKVALEILSALCEILDIAEQDEELHGDINASRVFLDDVGAVSLEAFGVDRAKSDCPEGTLKGPVTDVYGLGRVAYAILTPRDFPEVPYDDPDDHDDTIIDSVIQINLDDLPEDMVGDMQWFLCKFLSFDREDRPTALDAWRTFIAFADALDGELIEHWSVEAMEGGGERRDRESAMVRDLATEADADGEALGGPSVKKGPLSKGAISFGGGGKSGQATAFWSKDAMKAALDAEEEEDEGFKPSVGGGAATSFWTKEQIQAMREGKGDAPRPKRGGAGGGGERLSERPQTMFMAPPKRDDKPKAPPPPPPPPKATPKPPPPVAKAPPPQARPVVASGPASPVAVTGPGVTPAGPTGPMSPRPVVEEESGGGKGLILALAGLVVLLILCLGLAAVFGGGYVLWGSSESTTESTLAVEQPEPEPDPEPVVPEPEPEPAVVSKPTSTSSRSGNKPSGSSSRRGTPPPKAEEKPKPAKPAPSTSGRRAAPKPTPPKPAPASGPVRVKFKVIGTGKMMCSNGTSRSIDNNATLTFQAYELPGYCRIDIDGKGTCMAEFSSSVQCTCKDGVVEASCR